jgi:hypothetical protein
MDAASPEIVFRDLVERDQDERRELQRACATLVARRYPSAGEKADLDRIRRLLKQLGEEIPTAGKPDAPDASAAPSAKPAPPPKRNPFEVADRLFVAARDVFNTKSLLDRTLFNHEGGVLNAGGDVPFAEVSTVALVLGLLAIEGAPRPPLEVVDASTGRSRIAVVKGHPLTREFATAFFAAYGKATALEGIARKVLRILVEEGNPFQNGDESGRSVSTQEFARAVLGLDKKGVGENEPQLRRRVNECLDAIQSVGVDKPFSDVGIALPDLYQATDFRIQAENIKLAGPMICAAMFDDLKVFQVVDKLIELFQHGMLPIGNGPAGDLLYDYWKTTPNRMSEAERRNFYAITIGIPGGDVNGQANRDYNDLWLRFVSSVSSLVRQATADQMLRAAYPAAITQQQVRKAARDLAANLSLHGYGMVHYAARDLQAQIKTIIDLLGDAEIRSAYGAKDMWQVIDQVATLELGGARNSSRCRTLATCGAIITSWLAKNVNRYNKATSQPVINVADVLSNDPPASENPTTDPYDYDLVNACELWLADTATPGDRVEEFSQPREAPTATSRPVAIPSIAREMLEQAGLPDLGLALGRTRN